MRDWLTCIALCVLALTAIAQTWMMARKKQ